jgi:type VI secretion system protein ImpA
MGSPATIELDRLLAPIAEENAAGDDLRADTSPVSPYYQLKDARKSARARERNLGAEDGQLPDTRAEWRPVLEQATELLCNRSKDLEVVAWLIEALVRLHGFAGLRDGFKFARAFVSSFWESFYPLPGDEGVEERIAPLAGLNGQDAEGTLVMPIRSIPITEEHSVGPFATWHFQQALAVQQIADVQAREKRIEAGATTLDAIDKASLEADTEFLKRQYDDLQACRDEFDELTVTLDALCGAEAAPQSSNIKNELNACLEAVKYVGKRVITQPIEDAAEEVPENASGADVAVPSTRGAAMDREQAFVQLLQLAEFFRRTEPHSPLSYAIERIVRWGRMPLPELLGEIITEDDARNNLFWLAGITKPGSTETEN